MSFRSSGDEGADPSATPTLLGGDVAKYRISSIDSP
jgi:hypothetical protein